jgi:hypothetical protein
MPAKGSVPAPAAASSSASNIRETKVKVHGVEKTVRTEHSGTSKQLETMHTQRVKDAINELHVAGRDKALQAFDRTPAKPGQGEKEIAAQRKRLQGDSITSPVAHQKLSKQFPKVGRSQKKAAEKVKDFMGDGPDDPKRSHNYGL